MSTPSCTARMTLTTHHTLTIHFCSLQCCPLVLLPPSHQGPVTFHSPLPPCLPGVHGTPHGCSPFPHTAMLDALIQQQADPLQHGALGDGPSKCASRSSHPTLAPASSSCSAARCCAMATASGNKGQAARARAGRWSEGRSFPKK
jgi:hypothetical protein